MLSGKKVLSLFVLIIPWLTIPLIGRKTFIRYLPAATIVNLIVGYFSVIAEKKKFWKIKNPLFPYSPIDFSYQLGLFFVTTIWVFKLTFGDFKKYLLLNVVIDYLLSYPIVKTLTKFGLFEFKKLRPRHFYSISVVLAILIYWYQILVEKVIRGVKAVHSD